MLLEQDVFEFLCSHQTVIALRAHYTLHGRLKVSKDTLKTKRKDRQCRGQRLKTKDRQGRGQNAKAKDRQGRGQRHHALAVNKKHVLHEAGRDVLNLTLVQSVYEAFRFVGLVEDNESRPVPTLGAPLI